MRSINGPVAVASIMDWRAGFNTVSVEGMEVIQYTLWERQTYTSAVTTEQTFFTAQTQGINGNMELAGQLPNNWWFLIQSIRYAPLLDTSETALAVPAAGASDGALQDLMNLVNNSHAELVIGSKSYGRWPSYMLPAGGGVVGGFGNVGGTAANMAQVQHASNGSPDIANAYTLGIPLAIPPQFNFNLTVRYNGAQTLTGGNPPVLVCLDGELMRPKQ